MTELSIRAAAVEAGGRPAIITVDRTWTFAECADAALAVPGDLPPRRRDSGADRVIATPDVTTILTVFAALEARRPLALFHAKLTAQQRAEQAAAYDASDSDSDSDSDSGSDSDVDRDEPSAMPSGFSVKVHDHQLQPTSIRSTEGAATLPADTAFVLFTSGTTGTSRGVVLSRSAIIAAARSSEARFGWRDDDRWLLALPMAHAGGLSIVVRCLIARKPMVLLEGDFDPARVAELIARARPTLASLVPAQLTELIAQPAGALRAVVLGGAASAPSLVDAAVAAGWPVYPSYGLTETFGQIATATRPGGPLVVLPGLAVECSDTISIRGPQLATRYLDGTPIAPELVTSDLGELVDGTLRVLGRRDDMINTGGEKVHPLDVERVVAATPGVRAACVFGVDDVRFGRAVAVAIVGDDQFDQSAAIDHWRHALPSHARPRWFARLERLPLLPSGKPDRRAIAALPVEPIRR